MTGIKIVSNSAISRGIQILDGETGTPIHGVTSVDIRIRPNEIITAELTIFCEKIETPATARVMAVDPKAGGTKEVRRIEFVDGTVYEA